MPDKPKHRPQGRRVPPLQPGERRQYAPGQLITRLAPVVRQNIEQLAVAGYERDGRGALMVQLSEAEATGIVSAQYLSVMEIAEMNRAVPFADAQPVSEAVKHYQPDREFVALVMDVTPTLPGPHIWFDVFPRTGLGHADEPTPTSAATPRGRRAPPPTSSQDRAMATAYAPLEDMARAGFAEQGRGFLFYGVYTGGGAEPFVQYMTLDTSPGDGFATNAPDLVEHVRTYDPHTSFVIFDATINLKTEVLEQVEIEVMTFLTGQTTPSA